MGCLFFFYGDAVDEGVFLVYWMLARSWSR